MSPIDTQKEYLKYVDKNKSLNRFLNLRLFRILIFEFLLSVYNYQNFLYMK